jgi:RNA polymerase sigma factor for flagellar operon FliA
MQHHIPETDKYPDLAADAERTYSCVKYVCKKFKIIGNILSLNEYNNIISSVLEYKTTGSQKNHITNTIIESIEDALLEELENVSLLLSEKCSLSTRALKTETGCQALLVELGYKDSEFKERSLLKLPGTFEINSLLSIRRLITLQEFIKSGSLVNQLIYIWNETERSGNFDETRIKLTSFAPSFERVMWALLTFESTKHTNLVWHEANKLERIIPNKESSDMLAYGYLGLRTALRLYDPTLGFRFSTYACSRINGNIRDGVRAESPIPKRLTTFQRKITAAEAVLVQELGRVPSLAELSAKVGEDISKFSILPKLAPEASLDELTEGLDGSRKTSKWEIDDCDPALLVLQNFEKESIAVALDNLPSNEALAIQLLIIEGLGVAEAASLIGVDTRQLRVLREKALLKLRSELSSLNNR